MRTTRLRTRLAATAAAALLLLALELFRPSEARAQWTTSGTNNITTTNNVGVGTTNPQAAVHVERNVDGDANFLVINNGGGANSRSIFLLGEGTSNARYAYLAYYGSNHPTRANSTVFTNTGAGGFNISSFGGQNSTGGTITFSTSPVAAQGGNDAIAERMRIAPNGNVGVGTTAPIRGMQISGGNGTVGAEFAIANTGMSATYRNFNVWGNSTAGTAGQWYLRALNDAGTASGRDFLAFDNATGGVGIGATGNFYGFKLTVSDPTAGTGLSNFLNLSNYVDADLNFKITQSGASSKYALVTPSVANVPIVLSTNSGGRVGIGTTAPATALHVVGDITVSGNINSKYQDVAEWVPSVQKLAAGTVVVLDAGKTNHVVASTTAYDMKVAGVVSAEPGIILGVGGDDKLKVATTGRVKVKVDASRGAIKVGDLLVTSEVEGVAMRSEPINIGGRQIHAPGTIIGKALEPLEKGTGEILVLLSLQ
ncbi:MAG TPA: hypothetical protein VF297_16645 [Pyrinomonadaceae bacterium]